MEPRGNERKPPTESVANLLHNFHISLHNRSDNAGKTGQNTRTPASLTQPSPLRMSPAVKNDQMKLAMEAQQASEDHSWHLKLLEQQYQNHSEMQSAKVSTINNRLPRTDIPISDSRGAIESLVKVLTYHDESDSPNSTNARRTKRSDKISRWLAETTTSRQGTTMASYEDIASNLGRIYFEKAGSKTTHKDSRVPVWFSTERKISSQAETVQTQDIGPQSTTSCSWYSVTDLEVRPTIKATNSFDANNIVEPSATSKSNWDHVIDLEVEPNSEAERANRDRLQYTQSTSNAEEINSLTGRNWRTRNFATYVDDEFIGVTPIVGGFKTKLKDDSQPLTGPSSFGPDDDMPGMDKDGEDADDEDDQDEDWEKIEVVTKDQWNLDNDEDSHSMNEENRDDAGKGVHDKMEDGESLWQWLTHAPYLTWGKKV